MGHRRSQYALTDTAKTFAWLLFGLAIAWLARFIWACLTGRIEFVGMDM
jgi:hypothetical protein